MLIGLVIMGLPVADLSYNARLLLISLISVCSATCGLLLWLLHDARQNVDQQSLQLQPADLDQLCQSFSRMGQGLLPQKDVAETLQKILPDPLYSEAMRAFSPLDFNCHTSFGSILYIQIYPNQGSSRLQQQLKHAAKLYDGSMNVHNNGGAVISFGLIQADDYHAKHALSCALLIRELQIQSAQASQCIQMSLHSGHVLVGTLTSEASAHFSLAGDELKYAGRLCRATRGGEILISQILLDNLSKEIALSLQSQGYYPTLPNNYIPVKSYSLLSANQTLQDLIHRQSNHLLTQEIV